MAWSVFVKAACWAWRGASEEVLVWMEEWRVWISVRDIAERRTSFSGFGGMGGAGRLAA